MTVFEKYFLEVMKWYTDRKIDVLIHGSTLLNIVRQRNVGPRPGVRDDKEINLAILGEDFNDDLINKLREVNKYVRTIDHEDGSTTGVYYAKNPINFPTDEHWGIEPGLVFLTVLWKGNGFRYKRHEKNFCVKIKKEFVEDKTKWTDISVLNHGFKAPAGIGAYLDYYYGRWWEEDLSWHWTQSPNMVLFHDLIKGE